MIFLVQNAQNRDAKATQLKLDELIKTQKLARNKLIGAEEKSEELLEREKEKEKKAKNK
jgi:low affinity Fe/Cu permease